VSISYFYSHAGDFVHDSDTDILLFPVYMMLWVYVLIPDGAAVGTVYSVFVLFIYFFIVATYSSLGRLMLKTSAMASKHILESDSLDTMYSMEVQEQ